MMRKVRRQALKDYVLFPALTGPLFPLTLAGNATANVVRNLWAFTIIFCGHFPAGVATFTEDESEDETRGHWYQRQLLGSANITGSRLFHLMTGNLCTRSSTTCSRTCRPAATADRAPRSARSASGTGCDYNTGPLSRQLGSVAEKIVRLALPGRGRLPTMPSPFGRRTEPEAPGVADRTPGCVRLSRWT